jgi:hypothetical protein
MYGIEEATGLGGLAAQAPGGNQFMPQAMRISSAGSGIIAGPVIGRGGAGLPQSFGSTPLGGPPSVSWGGGSVQRPASQQLGSWREILDWHNSPAGWVLLLILAIYAWTHLSFRARGAAELGVARS